MDSVRKNDEQLLAKAAKHLDEARGATSANKRMLNIVLAYALISTKVGRPFEDLRIQIQELFHAQHKPDDAER